MLCQVLPIQYIFLASLLNNKPNTTSDYGEFPCIALISKCKRILLWEWLVLTEEEIMVSKSEFSHPTRENNVDSSSVKGHKEQIRWLQIQDHLFCIGKKGQSFASNFSFNVILVYFDLWNNNAFVTTIFMKKLKAVFILP